MEIKRMGFRFSIFLLALFSLVLNMISVSSVLGSDCFTTEDCDFNAGEGCFYNICSLSIGMSCSGELDCANNQFCDFSNAVNDPNSEGVCTFVSNEKVVNLGKYNWEDFWFLFPLLFCVLILFFVLFSLMEDRGANRRDSKSQLILGILLLLTIIFFFYWTYYGQDKCVVSSDTQLIASQNDIEGYLYKANAFILHNLLGCGKEETGIITRALFKVGDVLGLKQTPVDFVGDFLTGCMAGLFLWLIYEFALLTTSFTVKKLRGYNVTRPLAADSSGEKSKLLHGWLNMIASSPWKIVVIGAFYAVVMQIPFLSTFVNIITFNNFLGLNLGVSSIVRAILIAFYIGLLPSGFEAYARHKKRQNAYQRLIETKMGLKTIRTMGAQ